MRLVVDRSLVGFDQYVQIGRVLVGQLLLQCDVSQRFEVDDSRGHDRAGEYRTDDDGGQQSPVGDRPFEHELYRATHLGL